MDQLTKRRREFRVEIRREQCTQIFNSVRKSLIQISLSQSFISQYMNLIQQNQDAPEIMFRMQREIRSCDQTLIGTLSEACAQILLMKELYFWQSAHIQHISELVSRIYTNLQQDSKRQKHWRPFMQIMTSAIIEKWFLQRKIDDQIYSTVIEMMTFVSYYSDYQFKTFEEQIQKVLYAQTNRFSRQVQAIIFIALKLTPYNFLKTKSKETLYSMAKRMYQQNVRKINSQASAFILLVLQKKTVQKQDQQLYEQIMNNLDVNGSNYKQVLRVLQFQSYSKEGIHYEPNRRTLNIIYSFLRNIQDKCAFIKTIRNIIVNEMCSHQTIQTIYVQFFHTKLEVYLQHKPLIAIFSELVKYFTYPQQLPDQEELVGCVEILLLYHKNRLQEDIKKRLIYWWLLSKQKVEASKLFFVLSDQEMREFSRGLENNQEEQ